MTDAIGISGQVLQADALPVAPSDAEDCEDGSCRADDIGGQPVSIRDCESSGCSVAGRGSNGAWGSLLLLALFGRVRRSSVSQR